MTIQTDVRWIAGYIGPFPTNSEWRHDHNPDIKPGALYLLHAIDEPIYVGCTIDPRRRFRSHARKPWWSEVVRIEVIWYPDQVDARRAESRHHEARKYRYCRERPVFRYRSDFQPHPSSRWAEDRWA